MSLDPTAKLHSACSPVAASIAEFLSQNVAKCQESSRPNPQNAKTNPRPTDRSARPLAPRKLTAIELLLAGSTVAAAAARLGVNPRTIFRWLNDPRFRAEIDRRADLAERFKRAQRDVRAKRTAALTAVAKRQEMS